MDPQRHYFSILAIFLALGLGMILGSSWVRDEAWIREQENILATIEREFSALRSENRDYKIRLGEKRKDLKDLQGALRGFLGEVYGENLQGAGIFLYLDPAHKEEMLAVKDFFREQGAEIEIRSKADFEGQIPEEGYRIVWEKTASPRAKMEEGILFWGGDGENPLHLKHLLEKMRRAGT